LVFDDGRVLSESGAILYYFARDTAMFPEDIWEQANVLRWMFFEQYSHEPYIAVNRHLLKHSGIAGAAERVAANHPRGLQALAVMEQHLPGMPGSRPAAIRSPTSRSTPTRTARRKAASTWRTMPASGAGSTACGRSLVTSRKCRKSPVYRSSDGRVS
jgi:hypothetical protein